MDDQSRLDPLIHPAARLRLCAALAPGAPIDFAMARAATGLGASALSKHIHILMEAGYLRQTRDPVDGRRSWLGLTPAGRAAYQRHVAALLAMVQPSAAPAP